MAKTIDIELQKQLDKPQAWFCKYFPARIRNVSEREIADRKLVFDFKDGQAYEEVAQRTAANMTERYGTSCTNIVFSPVPASTDKKNEIRYKAFCQRVCELTGAINGYDYVSVSGVLRSAETEVWSLREITGTSHLASFPSCNPTDLYWLGVNKELFLSTIHFHGNPFAQFLTQACSFLPAVIELSP